MIKGEGLMIKGLHGYMEIKRRRRASRREKGTAKRSSLGGGTRAFYVFKKGSYRLICSIRCYVVFISFLLGGVYLRGIDNFMVKNTI